ncbi:MAG: Hsp20/alpha crystallin family protein [Candidatus Sumerlaeota bacterium]|nr:Hsp20/alpha crystallin family protein [Candidatus Sumerlaeota bacterium]
MNWWTNAFPEMEALRREIDRLFEDVDMPRFARVSFLPGLRARAYPLLNVREDGCAFYVEALAPGVDPESLNITVAHNQLTISGEKKPVNGGVEAEAFHRSERAAGRFTRAITLPSEVDSAAIKADYKNGLLLITLPKAEEAKAKQIAVNVG